MIAFQVSVLSMLFAALVLARFQYTSVLWTTRLGVVMLVQTAAWLGAGFLTCFAACRIMDRLFPNWHVGKPIWGGVTAGALLSIQVVALFLPTVFVFLSGPATIHIVETLARS
jgi:hypothetical protein